MGQKPAEIPPAAAPRIQDAHRLFDPSPQKLIEEVDIHAFEIGPKAGNGILIFLPVH